MDREKSNVLTTLRRIWNERDLNPPARAELRRDRREGLGADPGPRAAIEASVDWLCAAQDCSSPMDGGVARHYSLIEGWSASYPETTGYIIPTVIQCSDFLSRPELLVRAKRMTDWLVGIQLESGGFQGGLVNQPPVVPVTFNTGQILFGLSAAVRRFGEEYRRPMERAGDWLVAVQDDDGCWRSHPSPFAQKSEKSYDTHVAWGLLEAHRVSPDRGFAEAAIKNVRWALTKQRQNGWFELCGLTHEDAPVTHTIAYALRGVIEAFRFTRDSFFLDAALRTAEPFAKQVAADGSLPGRLDANWKAAAPWVCLTGSVQAAEDWFLLYKETGNTLYRDAGIRANANVRRTIRLDGPREVRGGVKGSFPIGGWHHKFDYLNWAAKFAIDANLAEIAL